MTCNGTPLTDILSKHQFHLVLPAKYQQGRIYVLDIDKDSQTLKGVDIFSTKALVKHSRALKIRTKADMVVGKYLEDRAIYQRGGHHYQPEGQEARTVHLGQDLMVPKGTPVYAPLSGRVHSFKDNTAPADYGPTIILEHHLEGITFYTLYGHLSRSSLNTLRVGTEIKSGQQIAVVGNSNENGGWPEHLHFQIIENMQGEKGNFKGVIEPSKIKEYAKLCPNPNLILKISALPM